MVGHGTIEVAKTVLEVADAAWTAVECCHHHEHEKQEDSRNRIEKTLLEKEEEELDALRSENQRLRKLLEQNLGLLQNLSESPSLLQDIPPDLHARLMDTVESPKFLTQLDSLRHNLTNECGLEFPFKEASVTDLHSAEVLINLDLEKPSYWVWVYDEMVPSSFEESSGIDNENYIIITEEQLVDGIANFMARCILSNPKAQNMTPDEMRKTLTKALGGMNKLEKLLHVWHAGKMFYALSTWGLALAGLYKARTAVRIAAMGVHASSKLVLKAL